ncbi:MAG: TonB-dependent receptor [Caulobacteraceae bacterium]|nr:TonB-dependent receptor [Caulobacteraceae bacterium]
MTPTHGVSSSHRVRLALLLGSALVAPSLALAQPVASEFNPPPPARAGPATVGEIVVTAQKRAENLQSVPISIQAFTTQKLEQLRVKSFEDYVKLLPSVSTTTGSTGIPGNSSVSFRGIATDGGLYLSGTLPTVGTYLDEQPISTITGAPDIHIYDIARVEALAGPQGTLYGASSEAGTIRIITNKPDFSRMSGGYNLEFNQVVDGGPGGIVEAYLNAPLVKDKIALRAVGWYDHTGGYISNVFKARTFPTSGITQTNGNLLESNANTTDTVGARAQLGIRLDENWTILPSVIAQRESWHGSFRADTTLPDLEVGHYYPEGGHDEWYQAGLTITGKIANFDITYAGDYMQRNSQSHNDYSDYGYFYDLVHGSGAYVVNNAGELINPSQLNINTDAYHKVSQEFRVASPRIGRFRAVAGLFYQRQYQKEENDYLTTGFADRLSVPGRPGQVWLTKEVRIDRDYAAFGQGDFEVTDKLTITGGIRGYRFDNSLVGFYGVNTTYFGTGVRQCLGPPVGPYGLGAAVVPGTPCTNLGVLNPDGSISPKTSKGDGVTWKANATYKFDPDHLVYFTASTGFRPGGINRAGTGAPFDADHLNNYELGSKNAFFDRRLTLNATIFQEDWNGVQVTYQAPGGSGVALIANAGGARTRGVEGDFAWQATRHFQLSGAGTYVDAKLTTPLFVGSTTPSAPAGQRLPLTPQVKGNLIGRYTFDLFGLDAHAQLAGVYVGERNPVLVTSDLAKTGVLPSYFTMDGAFGVAKGRTSLEVYIRNITDERGQLSRAAECNINVCGPSAADPVGEIYAVYIQPLTIGIRFGQSF